MRELHRRPAEVEVHLVHRHVAIVEVELAVDVVHRQLERAAGVDSGLRRARDQQAQIGLGTRGDPDLGAVRAARVDMDLGQDVAGARGVDRGPGLPPLLGKRCLELGAEGEFLGSSSTSIFKGSSPRGPLGERSLDRGELFHAAAGPDLGLTVASRHVFKCPFIWVDFQAAFQVAHGVRQAHPGDLAALGQVDVGVELDEAFGASRAPVIGSR